MMCLAAFEFNRQCRPSGCLTHLEGITSVNSPRIVLLYIQSQKRYAHDIFVANAIVAICRTRFNHTIVFYQGGMSMVACAWHENILLPLTLLRTRTEAGTHRHRHRHGHKWLFHTNTFKQTPTLHSKFVKVDNLKPAHEE